jgi:hypothetical protein
MSDSNHIQATNGYEFHRQLALFAYTGFLDHGFGIVEIRQDAYEQHPNGSVEAEAQYIPYGPNADKMSSEVLELLDEYDPKESFILCIRNASDACTAVTLEGQTQGATPEGVYLEALKQARKVQLVPGQVVQLKEQALDVSPGWYVFEKQRGGWLVLSVAGMDEDEGDIVTTDERVRLHIDYVELLQPTDMNVRDDA